MADDIPELKTETDYRLRSIDEVLSATLVKIRNDTAEANASLTTIRRIAIWFLVLSILGVLIGVLEIIAAGTGAKLF